MSQNLLSIQEAAKRLGVSTKTLRRWEKRGILLPIRTPGNQRRYSEDQIINFTKPQAQSQANILEEQFDSIHETFETLQIFQESVSIKEAIMGGFKSLDRFQKRAIFGSLGSFGIALVVLASLQSSLVAPLYQAAQNTFTSHLFPSPESSPAGGEENMVKAIDGAVLGIEDAPGAVFTLKLPAELKEELLVGKEATFSANITAPNVIYDLVAGNGIAISQGQTPTISTNITDASATVKGIASFSNSFFTVTSGAVSLKEGGITTTEIKDGTIANADLANSKVTVSAGTGLTGGGEVALGSSVTLTNAFGSSINLDSEVTGVLPIANGGSNKALTLAAGGVLWTDSDSFEVSAAGSSGQCLQSNGTSAPSWASCTASAVSGTTNTIAKFTSATTVGDSSITDNGTTVTVGVAGSFSSTLAVTGISTLTGNLNANGGLDVDDAFVVADGGALTTSQTATFNGTLAANGTVTIGDGGDTIAIDSSDWDITTGGNATGLGSITADGAITFSTFTSNGGPLYTNASGVLAQVTAGTSSQCLLGGTTPSFGSCEAGGIDAFWNQSSGALYPNNATVDLLVGATASSSAKFAVLNVNSGTPTASVSAGSAGGASLTATGTLATTAMQSLTLGGSTTGNIVIDSGSSSITLSDDTTVSGDLAVNGSTSADITTTTTTATIFNSTATTLSLGGAATTALNLGNGSGNYTAINLGSGAGTHTINIAGTGATAADTINIGTGGTGADTITIGNNASTTSLALTSGTGSQTFTSSVTTGTTTSSAFVFNASALTSGTALRLTSSSTTGKLIDLNATNTSGTIFNLAYGSSTTLDGDTTGLLVDLNSGTVVATNQNLTGVNFKIPTVTNTITTGTKTLRGLLVNFGTGSGINQNGTGGTLEYIAADFQMPALTQTAGTLNAMGLKITTPSTITTGGTAYGMRVATTGVGAGTLYGVSVDDITAGAGTEYAFNVAGTGWDAVLRVGSTTVINGSGVTQVPGGGTGVATFTSNGVLYGNSTSAIQVTAAGTTGQVLVGTTGSAPSWGTISGSSCTNCLVNDPSADQTISPTGVATTGLSVRQTSTASPTDDIFQVTNSAGSTKYFYVDKDGNVSTGAISNTTLTLTPTTNTTALTLVGTNVTSAKNQYINTKNSSGTVFDLSYGAAQTLAGTLTAANIDLSTNLTATNQSASGLVVTLPAATNTSGTQNYKGLVVTGGAINESTGGTATNYYGADITIPALTQTAGTLTAYGVSVTTPSSITTGGTAYGLYVNASGVGAGTLVGANITNITAGAGTEYALQIGNGWDQNLYFNDTTTNILLADGGTITIGDGTNSLCTITDSGTTGTLNCTGNITAGGGTVGGWTIASGAIYPGNTTLDLLIGGTGTSSAKFAVLNVNSGTPTASVSAGSAGGAYYNATGTFSTTTMQTLTLGGSTTGDIGFSPGNSTNALYLLTGGNVGIGDSTPDYLLELNDTTNTPTFALSDDDVAHGVTTVANTDSFFHISSISTTVGGAAINALADADGQALQLRGIMTANPTDTTPAVKIVGAVASGTGVTDLAAAETVLQVANNATNLMTILGNGNVGIANTAPAASLHIGSTSTNSSTGLIQVASCNSTCGGSRTWEFGVSNDQGGANQFAFRIEDTTNPTVATFRILYSTGNVGIGTATPAQKLDVAGNVFLNSGAAYQTQVDLLASGGGFAICHSGVADAIADITLYDCSSAPSADYAEMYPVEEGLEVGDVVVTGWELINTYDQENNVPNWNKVLGQVTKLVKSNQPYQQKVIGIISNNNSDLSSTGYNIKAEDNPRPVALNGRVLVKISPSSEPIEPGDFVTTSSDLGKAMKATRAGQMIGKALEPWTPGSGKDKVMVFVNIVYADPSGALANLSFAPDGSLYAPSVTAGRVVIDDSLLTDAQRAAMEAQEPGVSEDPAVVDVKKKIEFLSNRVSALEQSTSNTTNTTPDNSLSDLLASSSSVLGASAAADLSELNVEIATVSGTLNVLGRTTVGDIGVTGDIGAGLLKIKGLESSINTLAGDLKLQGNGLNGIDILNGKVTIDRDGNIKSVGEITVKKVNIYNSESESASIGESVIKKGETKVVISTTSVSTGSKIFLTPKTKLDGSLSIGTQKEGESFTAELSTPQNEDVKFNWWVVN